MKILAIRGDNEKYNDIIDFLKKIASRNYMGKFTERSYTINN